MHHPSGGRTRRAGLYNTQRRSTPTTLNRLGQTRILVVSSCSSCRRLASWALALGKQSKLHNYDCGVVLYGVCARDASSFASLRSCFVGRNPSITRTSLSISGHATRTNITRHQVGLRCGRRTMVGTPPNPQDPL